MACDRRAEIADLRLKQENEYNSLDLFMVSSNALIRTQLYACFSLV